MDFQQNISTPKTSCQKKYSNGMAIASMVLGIIAILTCSCIYLSMVCGSLGIILALLSRGGNPAMDTRGTVGLVLNSIGLVLTIVLYISVFLFMLRYYGGIDGIMQEYMNLYNADTIEELYQNMGII